jgi:DNA-binding transcriptional MerR regulator
VYGSNDLSRLRFIKRAKSLGFTLEEINDLLSLSSHRDGDMAAMKAAAAEKLASVEDKLAELARIRDGLKTLIAACPGHGVLETCPILHALDEGDA